MSTMDENEPIRLLDQRDLRVIGDATKVEVDMEHAVDAMRYEQRQRLLVDEDERKAKAMHQTELDRLIARARADGKTPEQITKIVNAHNALRACIGEVPEGFVEAEQSYNAAPKAATGFTRIEKGRRAQLVACACPGCANKVRRSSNRQAYCCDACRQRAKKFRTA